MQDFAPNGPYRDSCSIRTQVVDDDGEPVQNANVIYEIKQKGVAAYFSGYEPKTGVLSKEDSKSFKETDAGGFTNVRLMPGPNPAEAIIEIYARKNSVRSDTQEFAIRTVTPIQNKSNPTVELGPKTHVDQDVKTTVEPIFTGQTEPEIKPPPRAYRGQTTVQTDRPGILLPLTMLVLS